MSFLCINIFYGSLWGIIEASLGYLVHITKLSSTMVLLPIAFFFMKQVYKSTKKISSIFIISIISAGIKLLNLFTNVRLDKVINPSISIILEGCSFALMVWILKQIKEKRMINNFEKIGSIICMNTLWRIIYCAYLLLAPQWIYINSILMSKEKLIDFILTKNVITSIIITILFMLDDKIKIPVIKKVNPVVAFLLLITYIIVS